jgi:hypothetical protein
MDRINRVLSLLFIVILAVSSLMIVESAFTQSIPKLSVPEFTLKLVDNSYSVPKTVTIDPFTGANVTQPSHRVDNKTIEVIIQNQPFNPILIQEGKSNWTTAFYYNVQFKGHFSQNWIPIYFYGDPFPTPSNSDYTTIEYQLELTSPNASSYYLQVYREYDGSYSSIPTEIPSNAQIDFQVQAMIGNFHRGYNATATDPLQMFPWVFEGQTSDWNTQTITIPATSTLTSPSPNPTSTPTVPEFPILVILPLFVSVLLIATKFRLRRKPSKSL